jgi:hypothetical protein
MLYNVVEMKRRSDNPLLAALPHIACCGGPLLILAVVAGAVPLADVAVALGAIAAVALVGVVWLRRCRACARVRQDHTSSRPGRELGRVVAPGRGGSAPPRSGSLPALSGAGADSVDEAPARPATRTAGGAHLPPPR